MYSPPLSDLMDFIFFPKLFSIKAFKTLKIPNTYDLCFMKYSQQNLEQSSIKVRKYLEPLFDVVGICIETLLCIRSSIQAALCAFPTSYINEVGKAHRATSILYLIHSDVAGPIPTTSINGFRYFLTFINDCSRFCWIYFMKEKS